ncbi:MAG: hypothetical protein ACD_75C00152G0006, partial [uncultured bacterium]
TAHDDQMAEMADLAIPVASFSEYCGSVVNCDNILQSFAKAVTRNNDFADIGAIAAGLGSPLQTEAERFAELGKYIGALKDIKPDGIPAEGLNLNESEATNVKA